MTTGIMRPPFRKVFLVSGGRDPPATYLINDRNWWADLRLLHPTLNNVAKMPEQMTLLLNIGNGVFYLAERKFNMGYTQAMEMVNLISLEQGVWRHLQCNYYPPVPNVMIPIAVKAVMLCRNGKFSETLETPFEHQFHGWMVPAYVIVEAYHLEPWVNDLA